MSTVCPAEAVTSLAAAFKHKPLKKLKLSGIKLTLEAAEAIGQSLLEVSDFVTLELNGFAECSAKEACRLLEVAIPSRNIMSVVIPHVGYSNFIVKPYPEPFQGKLSRNLDYIQLSEAPDVTVFCKISVRRSKYYLEFSITRGRLNHSR